VAVVLVNIAEALMGLGRDDEAAARLDDAARCYDELGFRTQVGGARRAQAALALRRGEMHAARAFSRRALDDARAGQSPVGEVQAWCLLARVERKLWDFDKAQDCLRRARGCAESADVTSHPAVVAALQAAVAV
jgi:hypothetical protein